MTAWYVSLSTPVGSSVVGRGRVGQSEPRSVATRAAQLSSTFSAITVIEGVSLISVVLAVCGYSSRAPVRSLAGSAPAAAAPITNVGGVAFRITRKLSVSAGS